MELTNREAINQAIQEEMVRDDAVWILGEDVGFVEGTYRVTRGLLAEFGETRVLDTPIAEAGIVGLATGSALAGLRPIAELMTWNFSMVAADQIVNHMAKIGYMFGGKLHLPMVVRGPQGGRGRKSAQHSQSLEAIWTHVPGTIVIAPYHPSDMKGLLKSAVRSPDPVLFLEHEQLYSTKGEVPDDDDHLVPIGRSKVARRGEHVTLISYSYMVGQCLQAADTLAKEGIEAEVIDLRTLRPLDLEPVLESVAKTHRAVVAYEAWRTGGFGAEIAAQIYEHAFDQLDAPILRIGGEDVPAPYSPVLEDLVFPTAETVTNGVLEYFEI